MRKVICFLVILFGLLFSIICFAADQVQELSWWKMLLAHGLEFVFAILGIMATAFVTVLLKKFGFESQTAKINDVLDRAIGFAEQKSTKALKLDGKPDSSATKMNMAVNFAVQMAKEYKLPDKGKTWWEDKLESWLGVNSAEEIKEDLLKK